MANNTVVLPAYASKLYWHLFEKGSLPFAQGVDAGKRSCDVTFLVENGLAEITGDNLVLLAHGKEVIDG